MAVQQDLEFNKDHTQALADNGMYVLMGSIDSESVKPVVECWVRNDCQFRVINFPCWQ